MGVGGQSNAPAALPPGRRPGTHCIGGWVGPRAGLDGCGKSLPPLGLDPRTVQPVASRYTDWATRPTLRPNSDHMYNQQCTDMSFCVVYSNCRSLWPRGLRRRSATTRQLGSWVRIPPGAWTFVYCDCCVLSGKGLSDGLITHPVEYYRLWCVVVCDLETSWMRRPWPTGGLQRQREKKSI